MNYTAAPWMPASTPSSVLGDFVPSKDQMIDLQKAAHLAFTLTPATETIAYGILRELYHGDRTRLEITAAIHQNSPHDRLHMSARIHIGPRAYTSIHIYGWLKNGFQITDIEAARASRGGCVERIATFTPSPAQSDAGSVYSEE